jgi:membrane protein DedA with SNARE-associated domain
MKKLFLLVSILTAFVGTQATFAQGKYISRNAHVSFFSATNNGRY